MDDRKVYVLVSVCLVISLISVGFAGFTYYKTSRPHATNTNKNKPIPPDLNKTYWDNWRRADSVSDYQQILNQASRYEHNPSSWHSPPSVSIGQGFGVGPYDYVVFQGSADNYYAKSGDNGRIMYEGSDASTVVQNAVDSLSRGTVYLRGFDRPSGVTAPENVSIIAENLGDMTIDNSTWNFNSVNTEQALIGKTAGKTGEGAKRKLISNSDTTILVPEDYPTIQEAINQVPLFLRHDYVISIDKTSYDETLKENLVIQGLYGFEPIDNNEGTPGRLYIDTRNPGEYIEVGSYYITGVYGGAVVKLVYQSVNNVNPWADENGAIQGRKANSVALESCRLNSDITGDNGDGLVAYGGTWKVNGYDLGENNAKEGFKAKRGGRITVRDSGASGNVTDFVAHATSTGVISILNSTLTSNGSYACVSDFGLVYDADNDIIYGLNKLKGDITFKNNLLFDYEGRQIRAPNKTISMYSGQYKVRDEAGGAEFLWRDAKNDVNRFRVENRGITAISENTITTGSPIIMKDGVNFPPQSSAPSSPSQGTMVMADGVNWNPGSGSGLYVYDNGAWQYLGGAGTT